MSENLAQRGLHTIARKLEQLKKGDGDLVHLSHYNEIYEKFGCEEGSTYELLQPELANTQGDVACEKVVIAIPRELLDFMQRAVEVGHPPSLCKFVPLWGATWHWCDLTFIEPSVVKLDYGKVSTTGLSSFGIPLRYTELQEMI